MFKSLLLATSLTLALSACQTAPNHTNNQAIQQSVNHKVHSANFADIAYATQDERQKLDIYLPKNIQKGDKLPTVMFMHGGGWMFGDKYEVAHSPNMSVDKLVTRLLANGYAVVSVNYRFAPQHTMPTQTDDVTKAFEFIVKNGEKYQLDTGRIAVMGESAGGHLTHWLAVTQGKKIKASVPFYAPVQLDDFMGYAKKDPKCQGFSLSQVAKQAGMDVPDDFAFEEIAIGEKLGTPAYIAKAKTVSPLYQVSKNTPPTLMLHGDKDCLVHLKHSETMLEKLKQHQVPSELVVVKNANHAEKVFFETDDYQNKILVFLKKYL